jgi:hypothetical protein
MRSTQLSHVTVVEESCLVRAAVQHMACSLVLTKMDITWISSTHLHQSQSNFFTPFGWDVYQSSSSCNHTKAWW